MMLRTRTVKREFASNHAKALGSLAGPDVLEAHTASHYVSEIIYGADVAVTFQQEASSLEEMESLQGQLQAEVTAITALVTGSQADSRPVER